MACNFGGRFHTFYFITLEFVISVLGIYTKKKSGNTVKQGIRKRESQRYALRGKKNPKNLLNNYDIYIQWNITQQLKLFLGTS